MSEDELPEGWAATTIRESFDCWGGMTPSTGTLAFWGGTTPWVSSKDVKGDRIDGGTEFVTARALDETRLRKCRPGTVLVVVRSGVLVHTLPVAITDSEVVINQDLKAIDSGDDLINGWLALALKAQASEILEASRKDGTTVQSVRVDQLLDRGLPIPPLAEQRRIVEKVEALLAQVNAARARLAKVPTILKRFRQSILSAACSGRLSAGWDVDTVANASIQEEEIPEGWQWRELETLALPESSAICAGPFGTIFKAHDFRDEGVPIIFLRHVAPGEYRTAKPGFMDRKKWEDIFRPYSVWGGELLVAKLGDPPGCCAIYPKGIGPAMVTPDVIKMSVDERGACPQYLMYYLNSEPARQRAFGVAYGATRPRMNLDIFRALRVPLPPLPEQHHIVRRVDALFKLADAIEARVAAATARAEKITQAILAKAFRGELVPTEAELARQEGRDYEPASVLLARIRATHASPRPKPKRDQIARSR